VICGIDTRKLIDPLSYEENPRLESEKNYYKADHEILKSLGFTRTREIDDEISIMLDHLIKYRDRIEQKKDVIVKDIKWK